MKKVLCKQTDTRGLTVANNYYTVDNIYNDDGELYYNVGEFWNIVKSNKEINNSPLFYEWFYTEKEIRKIKLKKINIL